MSSDCLPLHHTLSLLHKFSCISSPCCVAVSAWSVSLDRKRSKFVIARQERQTCRWITSDVLLEIPVIFTSQSHSFAFVQGTEKDRKDAVEEGGESGEEEGGGDACRAQVERAEEIGQGSQSALREASAQFCHRCVCDIGHFLIIKFFSFSGQHIQPKRDMSRFVRWPKYVRLQRQHAVLYQRLKVPPPINQFRFALDRNNGEAMMH